MDRTELFEKYEQMTELLGTDDLLLNMVMALSNDDLQSILEFIDRTHETNVFYDGSWVSEVQDWMGKTLYSFEFEEHGEDCEWNAILKREEIAREQAQQEWGDNKEQCIKDGYKSVEALENAILDDLYVNSYDINGNPLPVNFG